MSAAAFVTNFSPFEVAHHVLLDPEGQESSLVVVSATFSSAGAGQLALADSQTAIAAADVPRADHARSSIRVESDLALSKRRVDVLFVGNAYAPAGRAVDALRVGLRVGDITKALLVQGDREWRGVGRGASDPVPFVRMPLVAERAFGGGNGTELDPRNPAGVGFAGGRSYDVAVTTQLPNVEYDAERVSTRMDRPRPAGLGVVARGWQPRLARAGTFDQAWLDERWPLMPADFDLLHYQSAPDDQQSDTIAGGEAVRLLNLTADGDWWFHLPRLDVPIRRFFADRTELFQPRLDTVIIDGERREVRLVARHARRTRRGREVLREIVVGHPTAAWLRARTARKSYIDGTGSGGAAGAQAHYRLA